MIYYVGNIPFDSSGLLHSGTRGMKWYHRLYQYKDGSLTPLGRIHYGIGEAREKAKANAEARRLARADSDKKSSTSKESSSSKSSKTKNVKEMSDEELDSRIRDLQTRLTRINKERQYSQLMRDVKNGGKTKDSKAFKFGQTLAGQILSASTRDIGTQLTKYWMGTMVNKIGEAATGDPHIVNPKHGQKDK